MSTPFAKFATKLLHWYDQHGRSNLPWRKQVSAYRVWLSETMLQQTQTTTVVPYFNKFMRQFPSIKKLSQAPLDDILQLWAGLGYYARARNLHKTAKIISEKHRGKFPRDIAILQSLPGIGRSTAGAIAAIAMQINAPILDANVKRVLTRLHAITSWPGTTSMQNQLWQLAEKHLPDKRIDDYTQAIMDLGAMLCIPKQPHCLDCPVAILCQAYQQGLQTELPKPKIKKPLPTKSIYLLLITNKKGAILIEKRPPVGIWGGLWSLPECPLEQDILAFCQKHYQHICKLQAYLPLFRHTFSHFHLDITPVKLQVLQPIANIMETSTRIWYKQEDALQYGFAAPIAKLLKNQHAIHMT